MKKIVLLIVVSILVISCNQTKIAYVNVEDLMEEYQGTKELQNELTKKQEEMTQLLDSLSAPFQNKVQAYYQNANKMSASKRTSTEQQLQQENQALQMQQQQYTQQFQLESQELSEALTKKVDSFVTDYAKLKGFDIVLGTSGNVTVMYGDQSLNITDEILEGLNEEFNIEK